jgi:phage/plasmid primase-like uncharacterized protein
LIITPHDGEYSSFRHQGSGDFRYGVGRNRSAQRGHTHRRSYPPFPYRGEQARNKERRVLCLPGGKEPQRAAKCFFQDHTRGSELEKWQFDTRGIEKATLRQWKASANSSEVRSKREADERKNRERSQRAREWAKRRYESASSAQPDHPYLVRKKAGVYGDLRQIGGSLIVPLRDIETGEFVTYQKIQASGYKNFVSPFCDRQAAFVIAGDIKEGPVILCEGLATGLTLYELVSCTTVCAMSSGNLAGIAGTLRKKYPDRKIFIATDDDTATAEKTGRNPGLEAAKKAMSAGLDGILRPPFLPEDRNDATDWNDYADLHGPDTAERILRGLMDNACLTPEEQKRREGMERIKRQTRLVNAADLMRKQMSPIRWAIDGILPAGLSILTGRPKTGKSSLSLGIILAVATGGSALGKIPTEAGNVLYLALEDTERRLQERVKAMRYGGADLSRSDFILELPRQHEGGLELVDDWLKNHSDARLVVIDTLQRFRKPHALGVNAYEDDYEALAPVKTLADRHDIAVMFLHHEKKSRDTEDFINNASGSAAITGASDCLLFLTRTRLQGIGRLKVTGRDVEEREYALSLNGMSWNLEGDAEEYAITQEKRQILAYLRENGETAPKTLADFLGVKLNTMLSSGAQNRSTKRRPRLTVSM